VRFRPDGVILPARRYLVVKRPLCLSGERWRPSRTAPMSAIRARTQLAGRNPSLKATTHLYSLSRRL
jgi:hypothetical protein